MVFFFCSAKMISIYTHYWVLYIVLCSVRCFVFVTFSWHHWYLMCICIIKWRVFYTIDIIVICDLLEKPNRERAYPKSTQSTYAENEKWMKNLIHWNKLKSTSFIISWQTTGKQNYNAKNPFRILTQMHIRHDKM